jgi:ubiquinol-cytochrome c reductase cytochrome c subunit
MRRGEVSILAAGVLFAAAVFVIGLQTGSPSAAATGSSDGQAPPDVEDLFRADCAVCHGAGGRGTSRGPSLVGVGEAAAHYQLTTGRMPLPDPDAPSRRRDPAYPPETIEALVDLVGSFGGGPDVPTVDVRGADVSRGGTLYRLNCAACHQSTGEGGALVQREAPPLDRSTPVQVVEAIRLGPGQMPQFGPAALDDAQARDVAAYVQYLRAPDDAGGLPIWHLGPVPEGAVAIIVGLGLAVLATTWIGSREPKEADER